jgi:peptide/nickel transport system permease protein
MLRFFLKKILAGLLVIWGVVTLLFLIFNLLGDPVGMMVGDNADAATQEAVRKAYHLDRPLHIQYLWYLNDLSPLGMSEDERAPDSGYHFGFKRPDFRRSFISNKKVSDIILGKFPGTLILSLVAMIFATFWGITLGVWSGTRPGTWVDRLVSFLAMIGTSAPSFFVAVILIRLFAVALGPWTGLNVTGYLFEERIFGEGYQVHWKNLFLPALALGIRPLSIFMQLTRSSMIEVMQSDYVRTAKAKGLSRKIVILRHALRNAINPLITSVSGWFASLLAGAFFIEFIFDWEGVGKLMIDALNSNDYPVILGASVFVGILFVVVNIAADLLYGFADPRVKLST